LALALKTTTKMIQAKAWYVYCNDIPSWRDLVWSPEIMQSKEGPFFVGYVEGKLNDARLVEAKCIANGFAGYRDTQPQDIPHKETEERMPFGREGYSEGPRITKRNNGKDRKRLPCFAIFALGDSFFFRLRSNRFAREFEKRWPMPHPSHRSKELPWSDSHNMLDCGRMNMIF
jgi:hypothetical protein